MNKTIELLNEYKAIALKDDTASEKRRKEILAYLGEHADEFPQKETDEAMRAWMNEIKEGCDDIKQRALREQMNEEMHSIIPMKIIARDYFGKSASWLSQRINGTKVRGKVYTLNAEQKQIFNHAMQDLSAKFGSFRLA